MKKIKNVRNIKKNLKYSILCFFSYYYCLMIEGSEAGSESIPLDNGSGSERPKNMSGTLRKPVSNK
jgi:hypothetical protein